MRAVIKLLKSEVSIVGNGNSTNVTQLWHK